MDIGTSLVAHRETTEAIEPGQRAFDHPAMAAQALTRLNATSRDARDNAALAAGQATACIVVALVGMQFGGTAARTTTMLPWLVDRRDRIERGLQ